MPLPRQTIIAIERLSNTEAPEATAAGEEEETLDADACIASADITTGKENSESLGSSTTSNT